MKINISLLFIAVLVIFTGCSNKPNVAVKKMSISECYNTLEPWMRGEKNVVGKTYISAVGISPFIQSRIDIMRENAKASARAAVANIIKTQVLKNLQKSDGATIAGRQSSSVGDIKITTEEITNQSLSAVEEIRSKMSPCDNSLYVLMGIKTKDLLMQLESKKLKMEAKEKLMKGERANVESGAKRLSKDIEALRKRIKDYEN